MDVRSEGLQGDRANDCQKPGRRSYETTKGNEEGDVGKSGGKGAKKTLLVVGKRERVPSDSGFRARALRSVKIESRESYRVA